MKDLFLVVVWVKGRPVIDGSEYFDTINESMEHIRKLPKVDDIEYTVCCIKRGSVAHSMGEKIIDILWEVKEGDKHPNKAYTEIYSVFNDIKNY